MTRWSKVRIANGGDKIRAACAVSQAQAETTRDSSFVRYTLLVKNHRRGRNSEPEQICQIFYGQLESIIDVVLPRAPHINIVMPKRHLLALVMPCSTGGRDATKVVTTYSLTTAPIVIDLRTVECVVGQVRRGNEWGIVDRSGDYARTVFVDPVQQEEQ
ncbi:hypothetical protein JB92DRAFT_3257362 [Gautieria morchelliformis]|nr:hypothetical protein JB92DRAFT_3257362 [Gautieria morchelliformis]